jgi:hypothetical protein
MGAYFARFIFSIPKSSTNGIVYIETSLSSSYLASVRGFIKDETFRNTSGGISG